MGKNKLAKVNTNKKVKKKCKTKKKPIKNIIDVPLSDNISLGSDASLGNISYNYQKYYNTFSFLNKIINRDKYLQKLVCIPDNNNIHPGFVNVSFYNAFDSDKKILKSIEPVNIFTSKEEFIDEIHNCMTHRLIPLSLQIDVGKAGTHANIILFDTHKKTVELFEPHGKYHNNSSLESITHAYFKVSNNVNKFIKVNFPEYTYISPSSYEPPYSLQSRIDAFNGMCVTWSILYLHYRILNPDIPQDKLTYYIDYTMTKNKLLRYTRYIEDIIKGKI